MNEECKYNIDGKCTYYKEKFPDNGAAKLDFDCEEDYCPIKKPWIVTEVLTQQ